MTKQQWIDLFEKNGLIVIDFFPKQDKIYHFSIYNYERHGYMRWAHMRKMDDGKYYVKLFWQTEVLGELHEEESILDDDEYILRVIFGFMETPLENLEICKEEVVEEKEDKWEQLRLF